MQQLAMYVALVEERERRERERRPAHPVALRELRAEQIAGGGPRRSSRGGRLRVLRWSRA